MPTPPETEAPPEPSDTYVPVANWEFINTTPTPEAMLDLLGTLPDQWGVRVADYADYVQALPASKKIKVEKPKPNGTGTVQAEEWLPIYTLYMTVAGREQMLRAAAEINDWRVDVGPADIPNAAPGFIELGAESGQRITYREQVTVFRCERDSDGDTVQVLLGTKTGTSSVPAVGGGKILEDNRYEKVETAARGRAIAAWGIGVLPGSGVASVEEMLYQSDPKFQRARAGRGGAPRLGRDAQIDGIHDSMEELRQARGQSREELLESVGEYVAQTWNKEVVAGGMLDLTRLKDGQLSLLQGMLEQQIGRASTIDDPAGS